MTPPRATLPVLFVIPAKAGTQLFVRVASKNSGPGLRRGDNYSMGVAR